MSWPAGTRLFGNHAVIFGGTAPTGGVDGQWFIRTDTTPRRVYGPKAAGVWPTSYVLLVGPTSIDADGYRAYLYSPGAHTFYKPAGMAYAQVMVMGGGGGGGGGSYGGLNSWGGGGGGGGGRTEAWFNASDLAASEDLNVGSSGSFGSDNYPSNGFPGGDGGASWFGGSTAATAKLWAGGGTGGGGGSNSAHLGTAAGGTGMFPGGLGGADSAGGGTPSAMGEHR